MGIRRKPESDDVEKRWRETEGKFAALISAKSACDRRKASSVLRLAVIASKESGETDLVWKHLRNVSDQLSSLEKKTSTTKATRFSIGNWGSSLRQRARPAPAPPP